MIDHDSVYEIQFGQDDLYLIIINCFFMHKLNATIETAGITSPHQDLQHFQTPSMIRCTYSHGNNQR